MVDLIAEFLRRRNGSLPIWEGKKSCPGSLRMAAVGDLKDNWPK